MRLVDSIETNTKHYVEIMSRAVDNVMPAPSTDVKYVILKLGSTRTNIYQLQGRRPRRADDTATGAKPRIAGGF